MSHAIFTKKTSYLFLITPILFLVGLFFYLPIGQAFFWSLFLEQPFGGGSEFVGLDNFYLLFSDPHFWKSIWRTLLFMIIAPGLSIFLSLILAIAANRKLKSSTFARNILLWPKAISGASIGIIFVFIFDPFYGVLSPLNDLYPEIWNPRIDGKDAFIMLAIAQIWSGIPFNFIILLSGLQAIPPQLDKAAAMDGASPWRRIRDIHLPLLTPQLFLTFILEFVGAAVEAFGLIDTMTKGGPGGSTTLLIYKIYLDGFRSYDLSGAAAQTVLLMIFVIFMVILQFRLEKHVKYER